MKFKFKKGDILTNVVPQYTLIKYKIVDVRDDRGGLYDVLELGGTNQVYKNMTKFTIECMLKKLKNNKVGW